MKDLTPQPRMKAVMHFKLTREDRHEIDNVAQRVGVTSSEFVRYAVRKALVAAQKELSKA